MADERPVEVVLRFQRLDIEIKRFLSYSIESDYTVSTDGWEVEIFEDRPAELAKLRDIELEPVEILFDGKQQLLGRVEKTSVGGNGSAIKVMGRDYLADAVECNVDPALKIKEQQTLAEAVALALSPVGITKVVGDSIAARNVRTGRAIKGSAPKDFLALKLEELKPEPGTGCFDFCNRLAARHGATIQPLTKRSEVSLEAPDYAQKASYAIRRTRDPNMNAATNIKRATADRDYTRMPTAALFTAKNGRSGESASALSMALDMRTLSNEFGGELRAKLPRIAPGAGTASRRKPGQAGALQDGTLYRFLYMRDEESRNAAQVERAAKRAIAERLKDTLEYRVTLRGHVDPKTGAFWAVNTIVDVDDDVCNVHEPLWVHSRAFRHSPQEGSLADLVCWRPEAFQL